MIRTHQAGAAVFRSIMPEDIEWKPFPAFPPAARLAVLVGDPAQPGPYVIRVKVPKMMPQDRIYTVMSGVFYIGLGAEFNGDKVKAYPPGCVVILPGDTAHFHWAKSGEYVTQVTAIGPLGLEYIDVKDDPRSGHVLSQASRLNFATEGSATMGSFGRKFLVNTFGRPSGVLGRLGGIIMARTNRKCAAWVVGLLEVQPNDKVLEIGFGPGVGIELLAQAASDGYVFGIDPSKEMLDQAVARNARAKRPS